MNLDSYRKWLIGTWAVGFVIPFILVIVQFGSGKYGSKFSEPIGWLTSLTLPTILLMIGVMVGNPIGSGRADENVPAGEGGSVQGEIQTALDAKRAHERFIFNLALGASVIYLLIVNFVFFLEPFTNSKPQELMRDSKIFLAVFDSVISLLIGYFFGKR
jgi:hypothetical protein